jgi:hypothetical protein
MLWCLLSRDDEGPPPVRQGRPASSGGRELPRTEFPMGWHAATAVVQRAGIPPREPSTSRHRGASPRPHSAAWSHRPPSAPADRGGPRYGSASDSRIPLPARSRGHPPGDAGDAGDADWGTLLHDGLRSRSSSRARPRGRGISIHSFGIVASRVPRVSHQATHLTTSPAPAKPGAVPRRDGGPGSAGQRGQSAGEYGRRRLIAPHPAQGQDCREAPRPSRPASGFSTPWRGASGWSRVILYSWRSAER